MSMLFDDIMSSLNELKEHAEGKPTGVVVHRRNAPTIADVPEFTPKEIEDIPTNFKANDIINTDKNQNVENFAKKCDKCGYKNPEYVKICINCGKEL